MKKTAIEIIESAIKFRSLTIKDIRVNNDTQISLYATDGVGLTFSVEFVIVNPSQSRLCLMDVNHEDNFAVMYPIATNMRSMSRCIGMCLDEIIEHA